MATKALVNGKFQTRPGVYSTIKSGIKNPPVNQSYGNVLIIDDGIGAGFGGGSGINGIFKNGVDTVYEFNSIQDFKSFVKGGELYNLANPLFKPSKNFTGASKVFLAQARATTPAEITATLANGSFTIQTKDEGVGANGVLNGSLLTKGYAGKIVRTNIPNATATFVTSLTQAATVGLPKISKTVATNINVGDVFSITIEAVTKTVTASSTLPADLYNSFTTLINGDGAISSVVTASVTPTGLVITGDAVNITYIHTSSVTPAPAQFVFQVWHGTYKGLDAANNIPFDNIADVDTKAQLIIESTVVTTVAGLISWFQSSTDFNQGFVLKAGSVATGNIVVGDLVTYPGYILAANGTESYSDADFDAVLSKINNLDFTHILSMKYGANATSLNNTKLFDFVNVTSKYDRLLVIAGGYDKSSFEYGSGSSISTAAYYNSDKVIVVHGGYKKVNRIASSGFVTYSQLYKAAIVLGRCAGLPSYVPVTLKSIGIDGEVHLLDDAEQEKAIAKGVMYSYYDYELESFVAGLDINTLQRNEFLVNEDSTTFNWQLKRIEAELNKTIVVEGKKRFFGDNAGGNRNSSSPEEVVVWLKGLLDTKVAKDNADNLIIRYQNVEADISQDNLNVTYEFVGNTEISKIIATGTLIAD